MLGALRDTAMLDDLVQEAAFEDRPALVMRAGHPWPMPACRSIRRRCGTIRGYCLAVTRRCGTIGKR
jgi:hypothetical protein